MALNSRSSIDPRWVYHNRNVGYGLQLADIKIFSSNVSTKVYDAVTNTWTGSDSIIWLGKARIQSVSNSTSTNLADSAYNPTTVQHLQFQISEGRNKVTGVTAIPDLRPGDKVVVTNNPVDAQMTKFTFTISNVLQNSNPWERTFVCSIDTELDPTVV